MFFYHLEIFYFNSRPKFSLFVNIVFLNFEKLNFFAKYSKKTAISASQIVDKRENAKNKEIKILVLPPDSLKSQKSVFSDNLVHKYLRKCETQDKFSLFSVVQKGLNFKRKFERRENSNLVNEPVH